MGSALRWAGTWVAATALIVLGVDAAIELVVRDVTIARPAPMTPGEVGRQLREREGPTSTIAATSTTAEDGPRVTEGTGRTSMPVPSSAPAPTGSSIGPGGPQGSDVARPDPPGGPAAGTGTTTTATQGTSGRPDGWQEPGAP